MLSTSQLQFCPTCYFQQVSFREKCFSFKYNCNVSSLNHNFIIVLQKSIVYKLWIVQQMRKILFYGKLQIIFLFLKPPSLYSLQNDIKRLGRQLILKMQVFGDRITTSLVLKISLLGLFDLDESEEDEDDLLQRTGNFITTSASLPKGILKVRISDTCI